MQQQPDESHVCETCASEYAIEADPNFAMGEEDDG
jgi:protein-arginine kinase activator protein McsA